MEYIMYQRTLSQEFLGKARGILCTDSISTFLGHPAAFKNQPIHKDSGSWRLTKCQGDWDTTVSFAQTTTKHTLRPASITTRVGQGGNAKSTRPRTY